MPNIKGVNEVKRRLRKLEEKGRKANVSVIVGYTASYAAAVHEKVGMVLKGQKRRGRKAKGRYWDPQGKAQAKFLEGPARESGREIGQKVSDTVSRGGTVEQGLLIAGLFLQRLSQQRVPVDTGNLKASAFTRKE